MLKVIKKLAKYIIGALLIYLIVSEFLLPISVTKINIVVGIFVFTLGMPLLMTAVMANDSGRGGFKIIFFQVVAFSLPLVYVTCLVSSISLLYFFDNKQELALWVSSIAGIQLIIVVSIFAFIYIHGDVTDMIHKFKNRNKT